MTDNGDNIHIPDQGAVVDVTESALSGEESLTVRDEAAAAREEALRSRERAAKEREQAIDVRERSAERREATVLERERAADLRDHLADLRDAAAERRDALADQRDVDAIRRDEAAGDLEGESEPLLSPAQRRMDEESRTAATLDRMRSAADRRFSAGDRGHALADRVASAEDRRVAAEEYQAAILDELTGVLGRGPGLYELNRELARAIRSGEQFVLAFVDVNRLKAINDAHGHPVGDDVICSVADALVAHLRPYDPVVRFGGDEFVCALSGTSLAEARARLEAVNVTLSGLTPARSVTIGLAELQTDDTVGSLIQRADADLYRRRGQEVPDGHPAVEVGQR